MPIGKYHCDYCDKQFQDTPAARKRHLSSGQHQRARAQWYNSFKDPRGGGPLIQPDGSIAAGVCHHSVRTGTCKFGDSCRCFHPAQIISNPTSTSPGLNLAGPGNFIGNQFVAASPFPGDQMGVSWGNLPPSLQPPPEGGHPPLPFVDWG